MIILDSHDDSIFLKVGTITIKVHEKDVVTVIRFCKDYRKGCYIKTDSFQMSFGNLRTYDCKVKYVDGDSVCLNDILSLYQDYKKLMESVIDSQVQLIFE